MGPSVTACSSTQSTHTYPDMATRLLSFITTKNQGVSENTNIILTFQPLNPSNLYITQRKYALSVKNLSLTSHTSSCSLEGKQLRAGDDTGRVTNILLQLMKFAKNRTSTRSPKQ